MSPVMSGYESGVFSYISVVVMMLYIKHCNGISTHKHNWFKEGLSYSLPLFVALALRVIIGLTLIKLYGGHFHHLNGEVDIIWLQGIKEALLSLFGKNLQRYVLYAQAYFPIKIFVSMAALFILYIVIASVRQKNTRPIVLGFLVLVSLFSQSILQGAVMPYRTAQTIGLFVGFAGFLFASEKSVLHLKRKYVVILLLFLSFKQGIYLHEVLALNNQRWNNEEAIIHNIGIRLYKDFDVKKTVVFSCVSYDHGEWISEQVTAVMPDYKKWFYSGEKVFRKTKYIGTDVNSVLEWSSLAAFSQSQMKLYFSYCGYDLNVLNRFTEEDAQKYRIIAEENHMKPFEIRDMGEYILVCLNNKINGE